MIGSLSGRLLRKNRLGAGCLIAFGAVFFLFGGFFFVFMVARPFVQARMASNWIERPCRILASEVSESSSSDGGPTYGVRVRYEYTVDDNRYEGSRYDFAQISDSDYGGKQQIVQRYPAGSEAVCWVDPANPARSVLTREYRFAPFLTLFTLLFPGVGLLVIYGGIKTSRAKVVTPGPMGFLPEAMAQRGRGQVLLTSDVRRNLFVTVIVCVFWNGFIGVAAYFILRKSRGADLCLQLFFGVFAVIGLFILYTTIRKVLEAMKPRPNLRLDADRLRPGGMVQLKWDFAGDTGSTGRLRLTLIGRELATYRRGTDSVTDKSVFVKLSLVDTTSPMQIQRGSISMPVPAGVMHTFFAPNNKIEWAIELEQEIPNWPDVKCEYPVVMNLPVQGTEVRHA